MIPDKAPPFRDDARSRDEPEARRLYVSGKYDSIDRRASVILQELCQHMPVVGFHGKVDAFL
jgi:hypothetical protein